MREMAVHRRISLVAVLAVAAAPFVLAAAFAIVAYTPAFGDFRRALAGPVLSGWLELPVAIDGDAELVFANPMRLRILKVRIGDTTVPVGRQVRPVDLVELSFPLWPALAGNFDVSELVISGGRVDLTGQAGGGCPRGRWRACRPGFSTPVFPIISNSTTLR